VAGPRRISTGFPIKLTPAGVERLFLYPIQLTRPKTPAFLEKAGVTHKNTARL